MKQGNIASDQLLSIVERIERLEEQKTDIATDIKEVYNEADGHGYDAKAIRAIVKLRKKDAAERDEEEAILDLYMRSIGMKPELDDVA